MKIEIQHEMMIRVPQFPIDARLTDEWENLKASISISSLGFYDTIKDITSEDLPDIPSIIFHSIWKYFNRARFRATPYGSFAGFGMLKGNRVNQTNIITIDSKQILHKFISWDYWPELLKMPIKDAVLFFANSTYYQVGSSIRYVTYEEDKFQLSEVEADPVIFEILNACRFPVSIHALYLNPKLTSAHIALLGSMVDCQLLLTEKHPNIIGEDYFKRHGMEVTGKPLYYITERKAISGSLNKAVFKHLPNLVKMLSTSSEENRNSDLNQFISRFQRKFEQRKIPIMIALDPELGIGYGDFIELNTGDTLINKFTSMTTQINKVMESQTQKSFIQKALQRPDRSPILLESLQIDQKQTDPLLSNSIGVLCSVVDEMIIIDHLSGSTANALAGRFSIASEEVQSFCQQIAGIEQAANPGVLFFDIAYTAEVAVDNVNRRQRIYPYQVSLLNYDTSEDPLTLDDMYLCVINGELILFSKRLKKRLIPRLASAYNYTRSDLSLFRLLCDLQNQGINSPAYLSPSMLSPDLDFYPRVQYHNIVLSAAKWKLRYTTFEKYIPEGNQLDALKAYLNNLGIKNYALTRSGDRTLIFNTNDKTDLEALLFIFKKSKDFYLEEGFVPEQSIIQDETGRPYAHQFLLALTHNDEIYKEIGLREEIELTDPKVETIFVPGSEWLYYEIYTHPLRADSLLQERLSEFVKRHKKYILCWFFIRYNEGGDHIRFRIRIGKPAAIPLLISGLAELLKNEVQSGVVSEVLLKTYKRELDRYGASRMEQVEFHFDKDSQYVMQLLKHSFSSTAKYQLCIHLYLRIRNAGLFTESNFESLVLNNSNAFLKEHFAIHEDYKTLNSEFRDFKKQMPASLSGAVKSHLLSYEKSLIKILADCLAGGRPKLCSDLFHMHVNRLFASDQRTHEMVIYYFLSKELQYLKAKSA